MTPRVHHVIEIVVTYNTIKMADGEIYLLRTPYAGPYFYNVLNLGPGTVYIRADDDPEVEGRESETLPPFTADNLIIVPDGPEGVRFLAGPPYADLPDDNGRDPRRKRAHPKPTPRNEPGDGGNGHENGHENGNGGSAITVRLVRG